MLRVVFSWLKVSTKRLVCCLVALVTFVGVFNAGFEQKDYAVACSATTTMAQTISSRRSLRDILRGFFGIKDKQESAPQPGQSVYLGGFPLGFTLECDGVIVVAIGNVQTAFGDRNPCEGKNIKVGDIILSVDNKKLSSAKDMEKALDMSRGLPVKVQIRRGDEEFFEVITPELEASTSTFRLGIWIRDNAAGVGTLTYIKEDLRFGALGHPVADIDTNVVLPVLGGGIYKCSIVGVNKGTRGTPGELRGLFLRNGQQAGEIDKNNDFGVFGTATKEYLENNQITRKVLVAGKEGAKTGKAKILTTIDGSRPEEFDIEIVKLSYQTTSSNKSMVIKVVDDRLIEKTGGIVQGMSGSPIIQDGKLVGAVTHVFVSDPTKGFGVYIDWMIDN